MREFIIAHQLEVTAMMSRISSMIREGLEKGAEKAIITVSRESRSSAQNRKFHAMINDIAKTVELDSSYSLEAWKALLIDSFEQDLKSQGIRLPKPSQTVISLDGERAVTIRPSSTSFSKPVAANFIEFLYWFGQEHGATFSDESLEYYEEIARGRCQ